MLMFIKYLALAEIVMYLPESSHGRDCEVCGGYGRGEHGEDGQTNCIPYSLGNLLIAEHDG